MIVDTLSMVLIVALLVFVAASGGLASSLLNRRMLRELGLKIDHSNRNAKTVKIALDHFNAKVEAAAKEAVSEIVRPVEVTIVNTTDNPVPTEDASVQKP